jgi:RHS repeat-associated protein
MDGSFSLHTPIDFLAGAFTGKERDAETGLDYFGARYFSGAQGRFTTADPLMASAKASNPQTWNRYAYALNNPLKFVDPDGLEVPDACVKDQNCTIVIKLNVVYDQTMNRGRGPTQQQRATFEKDQLAKAQKDYGYSNMKLDATYTPGPRRSARMKRHLCSDRVTHTKNTICPRAREEASYHPRRRRALCRSIIRAGGV